MANSVEQDRADPIRSPLYQGMEARQENEYDRLRTQHLLHKDAMDGQLLRAPVSKSEPVRILDSATGDGLWMVDIAQQYPNAMLVGTDILEKHFEQLKDLPSSITFKVQSVLDEWPEEYNRAYDLVHQRYCLAMFSPENDEAIIRRLFALVKPGGYIQIVDADLLGYDSGKEHPGMTRMMEFMKRGFTEAGMNPVPGPSVAAWMRKAGATEIQEEVISFPMGRLATTTDKAQSTTANLCAMIDNFAMIGSKIPGYWYSPEDFKSLKEAVFKEMAETGNIWRFHVVVGRKPA